MQNAVNPIFKDKEFGIEPHKAFTFVLCKRNDFVDSLVKLLTDTKYPFLLLYFLIFKIRTSSNLLIKAKIDKKLLDEVLNEVKTKKRNLKTTP